LLQAVVAKIAANGRSIGEFRGIALYNPQRDREFTDLPESAPAADAIVSITTVRERYGVAEGMRLALQFVYQFLDRLNQPVWNDATFESLWTDFIEEMDHPVWIHRGVANVRNIQVETDRTDLADGIAIRGRDFDELGRLGFGDATLQRLSDDWSGFGASSFVLTIETATEKRPENFILTDLATPWTRAQRAVMTLRLLAPGDLSIGPMWIVRPARFDVGLGRGTGATGFSIPAIGSRYTLTADIVAKFPEMYARLRALEADSYREAPGNLDLALRAFMATYDRWPPGADSRLIDSITSLEAVLGSGTEIAFKLAFRVANLVGGSDAARVALLAEVKGFYDTRSTLVHGGRLGTKHEARLAMLDELRKTVRTVLAGFVTLATTPGHDYHKRFFDEELDFALTDTTRRGALRSAMRMP
jgi:hypothetical protein